jgi:Domain of unknown function (DUF4440)
MKILLCVLCSLVSFAATPDKPQVEKELLAAMDAYRDAITHNDTAALQRILGDGLLFTHSHGEFQDKAAVLKSATGKPHITRMEFSNTTVRVYGDTALVKCKVDLWHPDVVHMDILHVWVRGPNGWQLVGRQATLLAH